jgi:hypothetical protein
MRKIRLQLSYANVVSTLCLFLLLAGGSALAAGSLAKNSVGPRQLKSKSVTSGKIAKDAVTGAKIARGTITGADINLNALGTVPTATSAASAGNANTVGGYAASCPADTVLIRGVCFDGSSNPEVGSLKEATDACAAKGGYIPSAVALYSIRSIVNLGTGVGTSHQYTDSFYSNVGSGNYTTIVINGTGTTVEQSVDSPSKYICAYTLIR